MLDEREWALMSPALSKTIEDIQAYRRKTGASLSECPPQTSACHLYARLTGFVETNPNAIWHHRAADCGPFCRHCRRPLRTARASAKELLDRPIATAAPIANLDSTLRLPVLGRFDEFLLVRIPDGREGWIVSTTEAS